MGSLYDMADTLGIRVTKAFLVDITTGEVQEFLFNPAELEEIFEVEWVMHETVGLSHKRPQFKVCNNVEWRATAFFDQIYYERGKPQPPPSQTAAGSNTRTPNLIDDQGSGGGTEVEEYRKFVMSLATPRRVVAGGTNRIAAASPTPIHFEWPGMISTTVRLRRAKLKHVLFRVGTARPRAYAVDFEIFEDPAERIYADDVRKNGTIRSWAQGRTPRKG